MRYGSVWPLDSLRLHRAHVLAGRRKLCAVVRLRKFLGFGVVSRCFHTLAGGFLCLCSAGVQWSAALHTEELSAREEIHESVSDVVVYDMARNRSKLENSE